MNTTVKRTIFGALFLAVMLGGLLFHPIPYTILFAFISAVMLDEFFRMTMGKTYRGMQLATVFMGMVLFFAFNCYFRDQATLTQLVAACIFVFLCPMIASIFEKDHTDFLKTGYLYAGLVYVGLPLALSNAVVFRGGEYSGLLMVAFFCIIWASDVGAYCFGMLLGQKLWPAKMCPKISPKKSWAGYIGGLVMAMLAGAILHWTGLFPFSMLHSLIVAAIMHVMGVFGDLFESLWKRSTGVKDSGNLIPGHGGLMDRFDSSLFAFPVAFIYLVLFGLI